MINLITIPQRADIKAVYAINGDILTVSINGFTEVFDFTGLGEGVAEQIAIESLPLNPILSAEKTGDIIIVKAIQFYGKNEKELFENGSN